MKLLKSLSAALALAGSVFAADYNIDVSHTGLDFAVQHMVISKTKGEFTDFAGTVSMDEENLQTLKFDVVVKAASINTKNEKRDNHLRNPDFFDVEKFPEIKFVSTGVKNINGKKFDLVGNFTIRDVTKEVVIPMVYNGKVKSPWGQTVVGFEGGFAIDRMAYGLSWSKALETGGLVVGKEVEINLAVEAVMK